MVVKVCKAFYEPLFPGQVIHSSLTNPSGSRLIAHTIVNEAAPQMAPFHTKLGENETLHVVVACGPFTTNDNLAYEPFKVSIQTQIIL